MDIKKALDLVNSKLIEEEVERHYESIMLTYESTEASKWFNSHAIPKEVIVRLNEFVKAVAREEFFSIKDLNDVGEHEMLFRLRVLSVADSISKLIAGEDSAKTLGNLKEMLNPIKDVGRVDVLKHFGYYFKDYNAETFHPCLFIFRFEDVMNNNEKLANYALYNIIPEKVKEACTTKYKKLAEELATERALKSRVASKINSIVKGEKYE